MFQYQTIQSKLSGKVGFRQNEDPSGWQLTGLTTADHFVNDHHAMLTFTNLKSIATDFDSIAGITDKGGALTTWLETRMNASLKKMLNEWRAKKMKNISARTLIERQRLFRPEMGRGALSPNDGNFNGLEIVSTDAMSLAHQINRFALQLQEAQTVRVYLFRDGTRSPINFHDAVYTAEGGVQWFEVDWLLADGGKYFIGYDANRVSGQAVNGITFNDHMANGDSWAVGDHWSIAGFTTEVTQYTGGIGQMELEGDFVVSDDSNPQSGITWNAGNVNYGFSDNFGINLELTSVCDYSSFVVSQGDLFSYAWALRTAIDLLRELITNPNSAINRSSSNADYQKKILLFEINGDTESKGKKTGLLADYYDALLGIMFDSSTVDPVCLPCSKRKKARFRAVG